MTRSSTPEAIPFRPLSRWRRPTTPIDDAEYEYFCDCRCDQLPGTHTAGQCLSQPALP